MATASHIPTNQPASRERLPAAVQWIADLGDVVMDWIIGLGNISAFSLRTFGWLFARLPRRETLIPAFYQIGVLSWPVVALTGTFIGMVLVVQSYVQFRNLHMEAKLGAVINMSLVRELGPVLAATMLAGRVGSAMAAELGTMRVTEQIDALTTHGRQPHPVFGGAAVSRLPAVDSGLDDHGRLHGRGGRDVLRGRPVGDRLPSLPGELAALCGQFRPVCRRLQEPVLWRRHCRDRLLSRFPLRSGAEGVGRAATAAFVYSFVMILLLDLLLGIALDGVYFSLWPEARKTVLDAHHKAMVTASSEKPDRQRRWSNWSG